MVEGIVWRGPHVVYGDGSRGREPLRGPAHLEWGPHAWAMAWYLGCSDSRVSTGWASERETRVVTDRGYYTGEFERWEDPIRNVLIDFRDWLGGETDERFDPELALYVDRMCHHAC